MNSVIGAVVTPAATQTSGGVNAGLQLSRALAGFRAYELLVMSGEDGEEYEANGLKIGRYKCRNSMPALVRRCVPGYMTNTFDYSPGLVKDILTKRPPVVHIHNPHPALALWKIAQVCLRNKIPYVISSHGFNESANPRTWVGTNPLKLWLYEQLSGRPFRKAVRYADAVFFTSPPEFAVADKLGIPPGKRYIVTNGYDNFFREKPRQDDIEAIRQRFSLAGCGDPVFFFLGNHVANKGIDVLLEACHRLKASCKVVVGGAVKSKTSHAELLAKHRYAEIKNFVLFTDHLSRAELRALYYAADAFVFPSRSDTLPLVILDAMVAGLPVIATDVGGISFQVDDSTGRLISAGSPDALAAAMDELAISSGLRKALGKAGQARCVSRFCWNNSAQIASAIYDQIVGIRPRSP